ncbi:MAG: hypothetical protein KDD67_04765 [Ignavibacteriae bacterium]|nr:hypothetical protein [Ignavibacteriota bacterium]MCB9216358.1 hypothetical protein [Ignavibacteria bacterium]
MLANSYLILGPHGPSDIAFAAITQRHTIPLVWAFLAGSEGARFNKEGNEYFFAMNVDDGLKILDRGMAAWNYNNYFRDMFAPVGVFRQWLQNYRPETPIYINVTELIQRSPTPEQDVESLSNLGEKVREAFANIEEQQFTHFINDLRAMAHPFITVPITGDRERDAYILTFEVRDTASVEAEMALQMIGVDRDKSLLRAATATLPKLDAEEDESEILPAKEPREDDSFFTTVFAPEGTDIKKFFIDNLGMTLDRETPRYIFLEHNGERLKVIKLAKPVAQRVEEEMQDL